MSRYAEPVQEELCALVAERRGHFQMESGYHSEAWHTLGLLFDDLERLRPFVAELAQRLAAHDVEVVCGPVVGGAKLAELIAAELGIEWCIAERFERPGATGLFPVEYRVPDKQRQMVRERRVAIVDDAISAGSAVRGSYAGLTACGAQPVAMGALFVFGDRAALFAAEKGLALEGIAPVSFGMWRPEECPQCVAGVPVEVVSDAV